MDVKVGERYSYISEVRWFRCVKLDDEEYIVIKQDSILAIVEK